MFLIISEIYLFLFRTHVIYNVTFDNVDVDKAGIGLGFLEYEDNWGF